MHSLDLGTVLKGSPITNVQLVFGYIDILHPERERFSHADCRFIEEPDQETIPLVATGIKEQLDLIFGDGLWAKALGLFLLENIFLDRRSFRNMVQERFVPPGVSWKVGSGRALDIRYGLFQPPVVVVKAPHHCEGMINGPVRTRLGNGMSREYLKRSGGQLEVAYNRLNKHPCIINNHISLLVVLYLDLDHAHDLLSSLS